MLDTDVLIDVALERKPHFEASAQLIHFLDSAPRMAFVAWHTLSNFYYLVTPRRGGSGVRDFLIDLSRFVAVAPTDTDALRYAASLPMRDFEDAMQVAAARSCGAEVIVTRNVKEFRRSPIPARKPAQVLADLA